VKKLITFILVLCLVLGMGTVALAQPNGNGGDDYSDWETVPITKELTLVNKGTINPAEEFSFTIGEGFGVRDGVSIDAPEFDSDTFTISIGQGGTAGSANLTLPEFTQVGVYTYTLSEGEGNTAGMRYDSGEYNLVVTVINNPAFGEDEEPEFLRVLTITDGNNVKSDAFENTFEAGSLTVNKVVTGNYGDPNDEFEVTVTLTPNQGKVLKAAPIEAAGSESFNQDEETGVVTIVYTVKDGDSFTIHNIPYDVTYSVAETELAEGYDSPGYDENASGQFNAASLETTITNNRDIEIETGINLDSLPYLIILTVAIAGLAIFVVRKRLTVNE
jgi:pilin isopeptide linkage protein